MRAKDQSVPPNQNDFKKKGIAAETPIRQMNKSQVSVTSELSISRSQKSLSQGHSKVVLRSGHATLEERMQEQSSDIQKLQRENAQLKIMELSEDARQNLMKMQRFDRVLYPIESDRTLKKPIEEELRRLEKIKNEQKEMRGRYYDNELTITCLYNHIKLVHEMNRELAEREVLRKEKDEAVKKLHDQKRESLKEVRQLKQQIRMGGGRVTTPSKSEPKEIQPTPLKKQQITALNFIGATLRSKKYAEALQQIKKFLQKSKQSQPQACKLLQMFIPALDDQLDTLVLTKTYETKITEINILIEKTNKEIRANHFEQVQKIKYETLKSGSQYKNIGLLIESILNFKKVEDGQKNRRLVGDDSKSLQKINQKVKTIQDQLKTTKEQLIKQRISSAELLKNKQVLQKQIQKFKADIQRMRIQLENYKKNENQRGKINQNDEELKTLRISNVQILKTNQSLEEQIRKLKIEVEKIKKLQIELQTYRKNEVQQRRFGSKTRNAEDQLKSIREQLTKEKAARAEVDQLVIKLRAEIEVAKKSEAQQKRTAARLKQNEDQIKNLRQQLNSTRASNNQNTKLKQNLERELQKQKLEIEKARELQAELDNYRKNDAQQKRALARIKALESEIQLTKQELKKQKAGKLDLQRQYENISVQIQSFRKGETEQKRTANRMKQNQEEIKSLREQIAQLRATNNETSKANKVLQRQSQQLKAQSQKVKKLEVEIDVLKRSEAELKRTTAKAKSNEQQLRKVKQELNNLRETNVQGTRQKQTLEKQFEKMKFEIERMRKIQVQLDDYKRNDVEYKRVGQRAKTVEDQLRTVKEELQQERNKYIDLTREKQLKEKQIERLRQQIDQLRRQEVQNKRVLLKANKNEQDLKLLREQLNKERLTSSQNIKARQQLQRQTEKYRRIQQDLQQLKKNQKDSKTKEDIMIQNLREDLSLAQSDLTFSMNSIDKIMKAISGNKMAQELEKIRKQLTNSASPSSRKILPILDTFIRINGNSKDLESQIEKINKENNDKRKKMELEYKTLSDELTEYKQTSNLICQALKSTARIWARTRPQQLLQNNKIIDLLAAELKKGNHNHVLEQIELETIGLAESLLNLMGNEMTKLQDGYIKKIQLKDRQIEKIVYKQQNLTKEHTEKDKRIKAIQDENKNSQSMIDGLKKQNQGYIKEIQRLNKEYQKLTHEYNLIEEELKNEADKTNKLNKQLLQIKANANKISSEKQSFEGKLQEANQQISRLKKHTQDYVQQERKVLETLEFEGKEKEKFQRQLENFRRSLEKVEKQKEFLDKKTKSQDDAIAKYKQMQLLFESSIQEAEMKNQALQNTITLREKQIKAHQQKIKYLTEQNNKTERNIASMEKQLLKEKSQTEKTKKLLYETQSFADKQKHEFTRQIEKLNQQIKFDIEERQADRKHYNSVISRLEKNLNDAESHRNQQVKEIQTKMTLLLQEKEDARRELEIEQNKYREKLREVSRDLEFTSNTGEKQKIQLKKQVDRLTVELNSAIGNTEAEKLELMKQIERLNAEKQRLILERNEEKKIYHEQIERAKNEQYQINYQKLKKQREEIRSLQEQLDKLNEIIDINEGNYNKIVQDNKQMYERILEFENREKEYIQEIQSLKDKSTGELNNSHLQLRKNTELSKYVDKLQAQIKEFESTIASNSRQITFVNEQKERIRELEHKLDEVQHQNIKFRVHQDENLKLISKLREENIQLKTENAAIDRQLYATKSRPDFAQNEAMLVSRYEDMLRKYEQANELSIKFRIQNTNFERIIKERDIEIIKLNKDTDQYRKLSQERLREIQIANQQRSRIESKIIDLEKQYFLKELNLQKQIEILEQKLRQMGKQGEENIRIKTEMNDLHHQINSLKDEKIRFEREIIQLKNQVSQGERNIQLLGKEIDEKKAIIHLRQQQIKEHFMSMNRSLTQSMSQQPTTVTDISGTISLLERTAQDRKREIERLQSLLDTANKRFEEKNIELSSTSLEVRHLRMEKEMLDSNWRQRLDAGNDRNKELTKEIQTIRMNFDVRKEQYDSDFVNLKIEKDRLQRNLQDTERKLGDFKIDLDKALRDVTFKEEQHKIVLEKYNNLTKKHEDTLRDLQKFESQYNTLMQQNKLLTQQLIAKDDTNSRQIEKVNVNFNLRIDGLEKEIQAKRQIIQQKELQIRQYITKITNQNNESNALITGKQIQLKTSAMLMERTIEDLKRDNDRLQLQLEGLTKKVEEKILQNSNLMMQLKQSQLNAQLLQEQSKYKIETLSNKISDLLREVDSLKSEIKNMNIILETEKVRWKDERDKYQRIVNELNQRNRLLDESLQKSKIEKVTIVERERSLKSQLQMQEQQLKKAYENENKLEGGTRRVKEENKYLKQIVQMLDTNYVEDEEEDQNEIKILLKISEQISYLIERNIQLEKQMKSSSVRSHNNDDQWFSSLEFLIESLLDYLNDSQLIGHKNVTKFVYSAEFKAESLYEHKQKYIVYVENFIKELFQSVVTEISENINLYERTISDVKKFIESYFNSGDHKYLESLRRCLRNFQG